jgi:hypothetical protein
MLKAVKESVHRMTSHLQLINLRGRRDGHSCGDDYGLLPLQNSDASYFSGHRLSIARMISAAHRIASSMALIVAGTLFPPSDFCGRWFQ